MTGQIRRQRVKDSRCSQCRRMAIVFFEVQVKQEAVFNTKGRPYSRIKLPD